MQFYVPVTTSTEAPDEFVSGPDIAATHAKLVNETGTLIDYRIGIGPIYTLADGQSKVLKLRSNLGDLSVRANDQEPVAVTVQFGYGVDVSDSAAAIEADDDVRGEDFLALGIPYAMVSTGSVGPGSYSNEGAIGPIILTPVIVMGQHYSFHVLAAQTLTIQADTGNTIYGCRSL
jgi:hypothetical protein